ncbi:MAG: hypothetical protein EOO07_05045, partial [Chitinophagaceae bacterium]
MTTLWDLTFDKGDSKYLSKFTVHGIVGAGSERVGKSEATGDRLEEAKHINKSLS